MKIQRVTAEVADELISIAENHPDLVFQNNGYEYLSRRVWAANAAPIARVSEILREHVEGFQVFFNFRRSQSHGLVLRFDYLWTSFFRGVGYLPVSQLRDGFPSEQE